MKKKIITISREFGSGGRSLGLLVSEKLGIDFYDQKLIDKAVETTGFSREFIQEAGEYASSTSRLLFNMSLASAYSSVGTSSNYDKIYVAQNNIIRALAEEKPCVIVGRCADYILRDRTDCLNVFVCADKKYREKHVLENYGEEKGKSIEKRLEEKDRKRELYYKHYTGKNWGDARNYHLCVNTGEIGLDRAVEWIVERYLAED
ncbi:MAG: cytidylate kinase-like family protein [Clostridia bacterium]|nr:cytidylate kinase-like family protein [Clostridia bacterium]